MTSATEIALVLKLFRHDVARNRKRIGLTVLAIAWGTLSIVLLLSFGEGMKRAFHRGKNGMGEGIGILWPGATTRAYLGLPSGRTISFVDEDLEILRARIPSLASVSREYAKFSSIAAGTKTLNVRVRGVDPSFGEMRNIIPRAGGRFVNELDAKQKRRVVVLGDELATDLFGATEPVGKTVLINQSSFLVIGVMQAKVMMGMYSGPDKNQASMPATTFKSMFTDAKVGNFVYRPVSIELADQAKAEIYRVLAAKYRFDPEDRRSLGIWDTREDQRIVATSRSGSRSSSGSSGR
jgi:putative ABC transport system permease protein